MEDISQRKKGKLYINNIKNIPITRKKWLGMNEEKGEHKARKGKESHKKV